MLGGRPKVPPVSTALDSQRDRAVRKVRETFISLLGHSCAPSVIQWLSFFFFLGKTYTFQVGPNLPTSCVCLSIAVLTRVTCHPETPAPSQVLCVVELWGSLLAREQCLPEGVWISRWIAAQADPS